MLKLFALLTAAGLLAACGGHDGLETDGICVTDACLESRYLPPPPPPAPRPEPNPKARI